MPGRMRSRPVKAAGGSVLRSNEGVGLLTVRAPSKGFILARQRVRRGRRRGRGSRPSATRRAPRSVRDEVETRGAADAGLRSAATAAGDKTLKGATTAGMDPLDGELWGLRMVRSDLRGGPAGDKRGQGRHPRHRRRRPQPRHRAELRLRRCPATSHRTSPTIDGAVRVPRLRRPGRLGRQRPRHPRRRHHRAPRPTASASPASRPNVTLVEHPRRPGQRLLLPRAGRRRADLRRPTSASTSSTCPSTSTRGCTTAPHNPADRPEAQAEQRTIIAAMNRALNYAHRKGVTLVGSLGNNHEDLGNPRTDIASPDYPPGTRVPAADRQRDLPRPAGRGPARHRRVGARPVDDEGRLLQLRPRADRGSAPGGWFRDGFGTPTYRTNENLILSTYPRQRAAGRRAGSTPTGNITPAGSRPRRGKSCTAARLTVRLLPRTSRAPRWRRRTPPAWRR